MRTKTNNNKIYGANMGSGNESLKEDPRKTPRASGSSDLLVDLTENKTPKGRITTRESCQDAQCKKA